MASTEPKANERTQVTSTTSETAKKRNWKLIVTVAGIILLFLSLAVALSYLKEKPEDTSQGIIGSALNPKYNLRVELLNGTIVTLDSLHKPLLIDFFATWCVPCKLQFPAMNAVATRHPDLTIISISIDPHDSTNDLQTYKQEEGMNWTVARDIDNKAQSLFGFPNIPTLVFVNEKGIIANMKTGTATEEELESWIRNADSSGSSSSTTTEEGEIIVLYGIELNSNLGLPLFLFIGLYVALSPCLFPLMPMTILHVMGQDQREEEKESKWRRIRNLEWVVLLSLGIFLSFALFALVGLALGVAMVKYHVIINFIIGVILALIGLIILFPAIEERTFARLPISQGVTSMFQKERFSRWDLFILGFVYSLIALPCSGPAFLVLLPLIVGTANLFWTLSGLLLFAIGVFIPYVILVLLTAEARTRFIRNVRERFDLIKKITAAFTILLGILFMLPFFGGPDIFAF